MEIYGKRDDPVMTTVLRSTRCGWLPVMRQQLSEATGRLRGQPLKNVAEDARGPCP